MTMYRPPTPLQYLSVIQSMMVVRVSVLPLTLSVF